MLPSSSGQMVCSLLRSWGSSFSETFVHIHYRHTTSDAKQFGLFPKHVTAQIRVNNSTAVFVKSFAENIVEAAVRFLLDKYF